MTDSIDSRWPTLDEPAALTKIAAVLEGKLPPSPHALCDLLDAAAQRVAGAAGKTIVAVAGSAVTGERQEQVESTVDVETEIQVEKEVDGETVIETVKKMVPTKQTTTETVPTLTREYWVVQA